MASKWFANDVLFVEHGMVYGLSINLETLCIGSEVDVLAAMAEPKKHLEMVEKLAYVGVVIGRDEANATSRRDMDGGSPTGTSGGQQINTRRTQATKRVSRRKVRK